MRWKKLGLVFAPAREQSWMQTHASLPIPVHLEGDRFRIYFGTRDARSKTHIAFLEIDLKDPTTILRLADTPVLAPGTLGGFDGDGVYPSSMVEHEGSLRLYYIGWNSGNPQPMYYTAVGLADVARRWRNV